MPKALAIGSATFVGSHRQARLTLPLRNPQLAPATHKAESWLRGKAGTLEPQALAKAVEQQYGKDRTFSVPILTMAALSGRLGAGSDAWRLVRPLPFELAVLPHRLYKWLRLPVVSYALPALIAIGQARYEHLKPGNPLTRLVRQSFPREEPQGPYNAPARERRIPRSGAVDVVRRHESGRLRACETTK